MVVVASEGGGGGGGACVQGEKDWQERKTETKPYIIALLSFPFLFQHSTFPKRFMPFLNNEGY